MPSYRYDHSDRPLEGYTIEHALGRGGFGEVYYAVSDSGRQVALKAVQNYEDIELRGISHCMNLKSPHLVSIFDVKHNDRGDAFVIMEYVAGPSLRELLDESPEGLGPEKAAWFIREMAKGLALLHDAGVVHRDLKPHNVFVEDGYVKVGDYSLSKIMSASHRSGHTMTVGSVHYMAPEISLGRYDKTVDIYALGVLLYEMLTGSPPHVGETMGEVLMKHMSGEIDVSDLEEPFASVVQKAMAQNPEDRYQTVDEMVEALFGVDHIQNSVSGFNPQSLTVIAERAARFATASAEPRNEFDRPKVDRYAPPPRPRRTDPLVSSAETSTSFFLRFLEVFYHALFIKTYPRTILERRVNDEIPLHIRGLLAVVAGGVATITIAIMSRSEDEVGYFVVMTLALVGIHALVYRLFSSRLPDAPALWHRFMPLLAMGPVALFINESFSYFPDKDEFSWAVLFPLMIMDWRWLAAPVRPGRVMLLPTLFGGAVASVAGLMMAGDEFPLAGAICAMSALMLQLICPFDPKASEELAASSDWLDTLNSVFAAHREERERLKREIVNRTKHAVSQLKGKPLQSEPAEIAKQMLDVSSGSSSITLEVPREDAVSTSTVGLAGDSIQTAPVKHNSRPGSEHSSRVTALALAVLPFCSVGVLPFFGLHRFYTGRKITGTLWLFTLGFFGVGQLVDILMITLGGFRDSQGRHLVSSGVSDQKVNPLSTLPSPESMIHGGMNVVGGLLLLLVIPLGFLLGLDLPEMISDGVFRGMGMSSIDFEQFFGSGTRWKSMLFNLHATATAVLGITAMTLLALARRHCGFFHVFRVALTGAAFVGAYAVVQEQAWRVDWTDFAQGLNYGRPGQMLTTVFETDLFFALIFSPLLVSLGFVILSWPPKLRDIAGIPSAPAVAEQPDIQQEVH